MSPEPIIHATGDLFPRVPGVASTGGVAMNQPPVGLLSDIHGLVVKAMADIPSDERGRFVAIATQTGGKTTVNLAVAVKVNEKVNVVAWLGKTWGAPVAAGVMGEVRF